MAARITRAKKKIIGAHIPYRVPRLAELPARLRSVLGVIHLLFTTGHTAPSGAVLVRVDLVESALRLARMLRDLMPDEPEVQGLLALILVTDARRATRVSATGRLLRLEEQDRSQWDRSAIAEAHDLIMGVLRGGQAGRYVLQAAIAAVYAEAPSYAETDWPQVVALYDRLLELWPSAVVALNRAVPLAEVAGRPPRWPRSGRWSAVASSTCSSASGAPRRPRRRTSGPWTWPRTGRARVPGRTAGVAPTLSVSDSVPPRWVN